MDPALESQSASFNMVIYKEVFLVSNTSAICFSGNLPLLREGTFLTRPLCYLKHEPKEHFTASLVNVSHIRFFTSMRSKRSVNSAFLQNFDHETLITVISLVLVSLKQLRKDLEGHNRSRSYYMAALKLVK